MKKEIFLASALVLSSFAAPVFSQESADSNALLEAARQEGQVIYYTSSRADETEKLVELWQAQYPDIQLNVITRSAPDLITQIEAERAAGQNRVDVFRMTQPMVAELWRQRGYYESYATTWIDDLAPEHADFDGSYYMQGVDMLLGAYNSERVDPSELPTSIDDLLDQRWHGQMVIAHPGTAGNSLTYFLGLFQAGVIDWDWLARFAEQDVLFVRGNPDAARLVASGERLISPAISSLNLLTAKESGQPIDFYYIDEGNVVIVRPVGIMSNPPNPNAARLLLDFLFSPDTQSAMAEAGQFWPTNQSAQTPEGMPPLGEMTLINIDSDLLPDEDGTREFLQRFDEVFGRI